MTYENIKTELAALTDGLLLMSDSERPFDIVTINGTLPDTFAAVSGLPGADFQQEDAGAFFSKIIRNATADPADTAMMQLVKRYETLQQFLNENLSDLYVYRAGKSEVHIFISGKTGDGQELLLHTSAVAT